MRTGFALPQHGRIAGPEAIIAVATKAEELGYDSIWVSERLLWPVKPARPYPASADGSLPAASQLCLTPLELLAFAAAHTRRVAVGTSVLVLPLYQPVRLASELSTLDILSGGRLRVGLGQGWLPDEFTAVSVPMTRLGQRMDEYLEVLLRMWGPNPVEHTGELVTIPAAIVGHKPVQQPRPPLYLAAFTEPAMQRVARVADGWNPAGLPPAVMGQMFAAIRAMAAGHGRAPESLELVVRANLEILSESGGAARRPFSGTLAEIREDALRVREMGAHELIYDVSWSPAVADLGHLLELVEELRHLAE